LTFELTRQLAQLVRRARGHLADPQVGNRRGTVEPDVPVIVTVDLPCKFADYTALTARIIGAEG
jgi:hypothetical protein